MSSARIDAAVDGLLLQFAAIWGDRWSQRIEGIAYQMLRSQWVEILQGLTPAQVKEGIARCRQKHAYPPSLAEFRSACLDGQTDEQRAFAARSEPPPAALTHGTHADRQDEGQHRIAALMGAIKGQGVTRTDINIRNGTWTREHEKAWRENLADLPWLQVPEVEAWT